MKIDRASARIVIILLGVGALAWVAASLVGAHYYRMTFGLCLGGVWNSYCGGWVLTAVMKAVVVVAFVSALLIFNERRTA